MVSSIFNKSSSFVFLGLTMGMLSEGTAQVPVRLSRHVNTAAHEYLPCPTPSGDQLYFCGMDRTGFFDFKLDFIEHRNSGGEDVFVSQFEGGLWTDARPISTINTNWHEAITQVIEDGHFLVAGNYEENMGIRDGKDGLETADLFEIKQQGGAMRINHLPEPVNSLWTEADGWKVGDILLFVSDRPGENGNDYHMKGWAWNDHLWGNTDVYVAFYGDFGWEQVQRLPAPINSPGPERTPRLSPDGLTLWLAQWVENRGLEIMEFRRTDPSNWNQWTGPFPMDDINTLLDDWGYVETTRGSFWASALPLKFNPTAMAPGGDAGSFREINFRTGYSLFGRQTAALNRATQTDIFWKPPAGQTTHLNVSNVLFKFNEARLTDAGVESVKAVADWCHLNRSFTELLITGHTDNMGSTDYNLELSEQRAEAVATALRELDIPQTIRTVGMGEGEPLQNNHTPEGRAANRRVSFEFLKDRS